MQVLQRYNLPRLTNDHNNSLPRCVHLCQHCLVGNFIPVLRPSIRDWRFGEVEAYSEERKQFLVTFDRNNREWVYVDSNPFEAYLLHREYTHDKPAYTKQISEGSLDSLMYEPLPLDVENNAFFGCHDDDGLADSHALMHIFDDIPADMSLYLPSISEMIPNSPVSIDSANNATRSTLHPLDRAKSSSMVGRDAYMFCDF